MRGECLRGGRDAVHVVGGPGEPRPVVHRTDGRNVACECRDDGSRVRIEPDLDPVSRCDQEQHPTGGVELERREASARERAKQPCDGGLVSRFRVDELPHAIRQLDRSGFSSPGHSKTSCSRALASELDPCGRGDALRALESPTHRPRAF